MRSLSKPELRSLLSTARARSERDFVMILVAFWHGLRASEVVAIKAGSLADGHITVKRLKGSMKTVQPLVGHADPLFDERSALTKFALNVPNNQRLFPVGRVQFYRIVRRHALAAGLAKHLAHPHILKHTIAMQTIESAGIENTRQWLGHKSMSSTGEYLRVTDEQASKAVMRSLGGR